MSLVFTFSRRKQNHLSDSCIGSGSSRSLKLSSDVSGLLPVMGGEQSMEISELTSCPGWKMNGQMLCGKTGWIPDMMTIDGPKDVHLGSTVSWGPEEVSSEASTRSTTVVLLKAGEEGSWDSVFSICNFLTVASALVLRMLRSSGDFAISDTVVLGGVVDIKSAEDDEAAII